MRSDSINIALFVHVIGAMVLVGGLLTAAAAAVIGWKDEAVSLRRFSYWTLLAVAFTLRGGSAIVLLLLLGYSFVTQLFPACIVSLGRRPWASPAGAFAGILAGELTVLYVTVSGATVAKLAPAAPQLVKDLNVGIVALAVNVVVLVAVTLATRRAAERSGAARDVAAAAARGA